MKKKNSIAQINVSIAPLQDGLPEGGPPRLDVQHATSFSMPVFPTADLETEFWAAFLNPTFHHNDGPRCSLISGEDIWFGMSPSLHDKQSRVGTLVQELGEVQMQVNTCFLDFTAPLSVDQFFTVANVEQFVRLYFCHWYPHCPVLHQQSFDIASVSLPLLFAVCLTGAFYSSSQEIITTARRLLDLAEEYAFGSPAFIALLDESSFGKQTFAAGFEALQAAFSVVIIQNWEGTITARRRIRGSRYVEIISVGI